MSVLDQLLMAQGPAALPAPGTGAPGAPPPVVPGQVGGAAVGSQVGTPVGAQPAPAAVPALPMPGGALGNVMQTMQGAQEVVNADPLISQAMTAYRSDEKVRQEAANEVEGNIGKMAELRDKARPPIPERPDLQETPEAPVPEKKNPLRVFGQFMPLVVALGALSTRNAGVNAMNAATAMVNAAKANDKIEEAKQRQYWLDQTKVVVDQNNAMLKDYELKLKDRELQVADTQAEIAAIAAKNQDVLTLAQLKAGQFGPMVNLIKFRQGAVDQVANMVMQERQLQERTRLQEADDRRQWAMLSLQRIKAGQLSPGDVIGGLLTKIAAGQELTAGETKAIDTYRSFQGGGAGAAAGGSSLPLDVLEEGAAAAPAGGTPPGPTAPQPTPAAAKPAPAAPAAPAKAELRKSGTVYSTPQGPRRWMVVNGQSGWAAP
jgi:hypothetical protein